MSLNIPEGYEIQYLVRKPDGTLFMAPNRQPAFWLDRSECDGMIAHLDRKSVV